MGGMATGLIVGSAVAGTTPRSASATAARGGTTEMKTLDASTDHHFRAVFPVFDRALTATSRRLP